MNLLLYAVGLGAGFLLGEIIYDEFEFSFGGEKWKSLKKD